MSSFVSFDTHTRTHLFSMSQAFAWLFRHTHTHSFSTHTHALFRHTHTHSSFFDEPKARLLPVFVFGFFFLSLLFCIFPMDQLFAGVCLQHWHTIQGWLSRTKKCCYVSLICPNMSLICPDMSLICP